ncbi:hypothetical protein [Naumannella cuiyingiana]|uniref:Uncharacterized protein n=1 Tax=Naumannella cuiyingiana TaxID=1347891 RepID=A0A7Z0IMC7_9ACTN|nr:hypothetical protein [Naumannella cuiyingiana]NYI72457.1 hypothetical protein [Naumannella cuiyingiana]
MSEQGSTGNVAGQHGTPDPQWHHVGAHSHLAQRRDERRRRTRRNLITLGVIMALAAGAIIAVLTMAGRWGVPGFSYTNDLGSRCTNKILGHTCDQVSVAEINARAETTLPEQTEVLQSSYSEAQDWGLSAVVVVPAADAASTDAMLTERFGKCDGDLPADALPADEYTDTCRRSATQSFGADGDPVRSMHHVFSGVRPDGALVISLEVWTT